MPQGENEICTEVEAMVVRVGDGLMAVHILDDKKWWSIFTVLPYKSHDLNANGVDTGAKVS